MGLSYHFTFSAPSTVESHALLTFLKSVEADSTKMGFDPTIVLDASFDTRERREFARRIVPGVHIENDRLKGVVLPAQDRIWDFSPTLGHGRLAPYRAIFLVVTDEKRCESVFGFARYPETLQDINGRQLLKTPVGDRWYFRDFVDSSDKRYRQIVKRFSEAGYLEAERDEFVAR